jgi:hypothetical protein
MNSTQGFTKLIHLAKGYMFGQGGELAVAHTNGHALGIKMHLYFLLEIYHKTRRDPLFGSAAFVLKP